MTKDEVENCLKDATEVHFFSNRSILLFFSLEYEAERAYQAVKEFYGDEPLGLIFTMAGDDLWLLITDSNDRYAEIKGLAYDRSNLSDNLLCADKAYRFDLYLVHGHYFVESVLPAPNIASFLTQRQRRIDIAGVGVTA